MRYIDFHTHLLYGVDHGVQTREEFEKLLNQYSENGIDTIVFTPHKNHPQVRTFEDAIVKNYKEASEIAGKSGIKTYLGCEFYLNTGNKIQLTAVNNRFALCEFPTDIRPIGLEEQIEKIEELGLEIVVAHVERYRWLNPHSKDVAFLINHGAWFQINVSGLENRTAKPYIKRHLVDIIATDNHGTDGLAAKLRSALDKNPEVLEKMQDLGL